MHITKSVTYAAIALSATLVVISCSSSDSGTVDVDNTAVTDPTVTDPTDNSEIGGGSDFAFRVLSCEEAAAKFVTNGSANPDLPDPYVNASCVDDELVVNSNSMLDFPYIATSPGDPGEFETTYNIPATPLMAEATTQVSVIGSIAVAINGVPIYAATEGPGGDVKSRPGGFVECGGHNGPTGYHYHLFDPNGSDACRFSESEAQASPVLFGYALDGYPIYSGNYQFRSSYYLSDESLFATDTFAAHTYVEGSGDLDECNGRFDSNGNYAYYTTEDFPYTLACYRGVVELTGPEGPGGGGGGGGPAGGPADQ